VTVTPAGIDRPLESANVTAQVPTATDVTLKTAFGPFALAGETEATPLQVFDSANAPA
jgi:hypothetical protein